MKNVKTVIARPVIVKSNVTKSATPDWMQITDANSGEVLHTGRPYYIKRVAEKRYGQKVT